MAKQRQDQPTPDQLAPGQNEEQAPADQEQTGERLNRQECAVKAVSEVEGETTLAALAQRADSLYVAGGGKSNLDTARWKVYEVLQTAAGLGVLELTEVWEVQVRRVCK